jgi:hypothetical protein
MNLRKNGQISPCLKELSLEIMNTRAFVCSPTIITSEWQWKLLQRSISNYKLEEAHTKDNF